MNFTIGTLLALSFLISVLGLFLFLWAQMNGLMRAGPDAAEVIFAAGKSGRPKSRPCPHRNASASNKPPRMRCQHVPAHRATRRHSAGNSRNARGWTRRAAGRPSSF